MKTPKSKLLSQAPEIVFRIWNNRKAIELEAAVLFKRLGRDLSELRGPYDPVVLLAKEAANDELKHAELCQKILDLNPNYLKPIAPQLHTEMGPKNFRLSERVLYTCVAMSCVTETLSTALLVEMRTRAEEGLIKETVHQILSDEVNHSRIGWAELARAARSQDVSWLTRYIPKMLEAALVSDIAPMLSSREAQMDLSRWGILAPHEAKEIMARAVAEVIVPGLEKYSIHLNKIELGLNSSGL